MLKRSFFSDLYKYCSLPTFKFTFFLILGVSIFFSIQNIQVINALVEGNGQAVNLDLSMLSSNPVYTVRDALLSSPYQASVIFLPILVSLVYSTHYQFGDDNFTQLLIPNWKVRLTGFIASSIVLSLLATLIFSIVNAIILLENHIWPSSMKLLQTIYLDTVFFPFSCFHYTKGNSPITAREILFQNTSGII